jgi:uncharacterized protein YcbK (DUF882 family)
MRSWPWCRATLVTAAAGLLAALVPSPTGGSAEAIAVEGPRAHRLRLYNTHTGERLDVVYRRGDAYLPDALRKLEHHLRDFRSGDEQPFDPRLFDLLAELAEAAGKPEGEFQVISGYRSPETNEMLRRRTTGVAKNSLHTKAQAIDVRLPGVKTEKLREVALSLKRGGVGYYARSDFIHVDTGRVRRW